MIIYIDENIPPNFAKGFDLIQSTMNNRLSEPVNVRSIRDVYNKGIKDEDWIPLISKDKSCVITTDINIHRKKHLNELYRNYNIGLFYLKPKSKKIGMSSWEMANSLVKHWEEICKLSINEERPFLVEVNTRNKSLKSTRFR